MMGAGPLLQCYAYFLIAGCWTRFVSPSFATMTEKVQQAEGQLLDAHVRLRGSHAAPSTPALRAHPPHS